MRNLSIAITNLGICGVTGFAIHEVHHTAPLIFGLFVICMTTAWMKPPGKESDQ